MDAKYRCACRHLHGPRKCRFIVDVDTERECSCPAFKQPGRGAGAYRELGLGARGRNISRGGTAFGSPAYHLEAYGLRNPVVTECIERGFYHDLEERRPFVTDNLTPEGLDVAHQLGIYLDGEQLF